MHRHGELQGIRRCAHRKHHAVLVASKYGEVHGRPCLFSDLEQGVTHHAHDFVIDVVRRASMGMRRNVQVLADGIVAGEVLPDKLTAHNHLVRSSDTFVAGEEPATHKRNSEGAEVAWIGPTHKPVG